MMVNDLAELRRELAHLQREPLSIIKLSEPLTDPSPASTDLSTWRRPRRVSGGAIGDDGSGNGGGGGGDDDDTTTLHIGDQMNDGDPSPASLASDLEHYRALFKKLHFSYLEQVSKEKFLRAIVGDPPQVVEPAENVALEAELTHAKADLVQRKADVDKLVRELEQRGRALALRHDAVQLQIAQLDALPTEIEGLESRIAELEAEAAQRNSEASSKDAGEPRQRLPLRETQEALTARRNDVAEMDREIAALRNTLPNKTRQNERLEAELRSLDSQRWTAMQSAEEAKARKEQRDGGAEDPIELHGRWYQSAASMVRQLVGVDTDAVQAKT